MIDRTCSTAGCDKRVQARGLCNTHYWHAWKAEDFEPRKPPAQCIEADCVALAHSTVTGLCNKHHKRFRRHGSTEFLGRKGMRPATYKGDDITYITAHGRVRKARGSASAYRCVDCEGPALHWSYDHSDPNERFDENGRPFSPDVTHYEPRCVPCHSHFDKHLVTPRRIRPAS